ncbi:hypothetical protein Golob_011533 [Gossypium lobatum]|uniref:MULE transposase domain-containing protein n=1 Tax=Gossypium lobatum TaxID=34289 RepID=A0A7J8MQ96_9ROSI|nr:hypothetical protein [Gossypium lobatum]
MMSTTVVLVLETKVIVEYFEATIGDHPKMKEFAMSWDYADELRLKNPRSTIKMAVNRVTPKSPPYFKRFYVCFEALKKGWKEGCRPILGLDGCFLKGPFKGKLLATVGINGNNRMYLVA